MVLGHNSTSPIHQFHWAFKWRSIPTPQDVLIKAHLRAPLSQFLSFNRVWLEQDLCVFLCCTLLLCLFLGWFGIPQGLCAFRFSLLLVFLYQVLCGSSQDVETPQIHHPCRRLCIWTLWKERRCKRKALKRVLKAILPFPPFSISFKCKDKAMNIGWEGKVDQLVHSAQP